MYSHFETLQNAKGRKQNGGERTLSHSKFRSVVGVVKNYSSLAVNRTSCGHTRIHRVIITMLLRRRELLHVYCLSVKL